MSHYRLTPLKGSGWHRLGLLAAVAFLPFTVMLWSTGAFGGGAIGIQSALIFYGCSLLLVAVLSFGLSWAFRGFAVRAHAEDEEDEREHRHKPAARPTPAHPPAGKKAAAHH